MRRFIGIMSLIVSIGIFILTFNNFTGAIIGSSSFSFVRIASFLFFIFGIFLLTASRSLDAIVVPTGYGEEDERRALAAAREYNNNRTRKLVIAGVSDAAGRDKQAERIYDVLVGGGVKQEDIERVYAKNDGTTVGNVMEVVKKLEGKRVGFVTYPEHFRRTRQILDIAKRKKLIDENTVLYQIREKNAPFYERLNQAAYEVGASIKLMFSGEKRVDKYKK